MNLIVYSIPVFFILIGVELLVQFMTKSKLYRFNDAVTNINCGIASQVTNVLLKTVTFVLYVLIYEKARLFEIELNAFTWVLLFIGVDFFYYLFHRYSHEIAVLWGTHAVHHQSEEYNLSVALRQSAIQSLGSMWFYLPLAWIGFSPEAFITINAIQTLYQFWIHTRTINKMPAWFEYVFNTPAHHRVHHGVEPKYIDRNHGGTLILFDRWFGTFQAEEEEAHYGVTKPVNTWNPVWVNFEYYKWMWPVFMEAKGFDKIRVLLNKPGWRPDYLGGALLPGEVAPDYQKYDMDVAPKMQYYVFFQFLLVLVGTSLFLFSFEAMPWLERTVDVFLILWSVINIGGILDQKKWVFVSEMIRLIVIAGALLYMIPSLDWMLKAGIVGLMMISFMIYLTFKRSDSLNNSSKFAKSTS
jgi:sterol desaturase/sphingolipid hydroxylase (fatty acid hydroxylase superfamily)